MKSVQLLIERAAHELQALTPDIKQIYIDRLEGRGYRTPAAILTGSLERFGKACELKPEEARTIWAMAEEMTASGRSRLGKI